MREYPILHEKRVVGTLCAEQEGLYTIYTARCEPVGERLRLAVYGTDAHAYLGLMLPARDGRLFLRRRLSRLERSRLPARILFAAEEGIPRPGPEVPAPHRWQRKPDGTLRMGRYVAIPLEKVSAPGVPKHLLRDIGGRRYLVFCL